MATVFSNSKTSKIWKRIGNEQKWFLVFVKEQKNFKSLPNILLKKHISEMQLNMWISNKIKVCLMYGFIFVFNLWFLFPLTPALLSRRQHFYEKTSIFELWHLYHISLKWLFFSPNTSFWTKKVSFNDSFMMTWEKKVTTNFCLYDLLFFQESNNVVCDVAANFSAKTSVQINCFSYTRIFQLFQRFSNRKLFCFRCQAQ